MWLAIKYWYPKQQTAIFVNDEGMFFHHLRFTLFGWDLEKINPTGRWAPKNQLEVGLVITPLIGAIYNPSSPNYLQGHFSPNYLQGHF